MKQDPEETPAATGLTRRDLLGMLGATAAAPLLGLVGRQSALASGGAVSPPFQSALSRPAVPPCVVRPEQTEGPYFVDARLNRSDIRSDPSGAVKEGVPLRLVFHVSRVDEDACSVLPGAVVDVWQCDAEGVYSGFDDMNDQFDTRGQLFLRGYQVTDATGTATFTTVYPGWYRGRAVHIHFKIRTDPEAEQGHEFTSQLYFDESVTDEVHAHPLYAARGERTVKNSEDSIFRRGGDELMLRLAREGEGYSGTFDVGLQIA